MNEVNLEYTPAKRPAWRQVAKHAGQEAKFVSWEPGIGWSPPPQGARVQASKHATLPGKSKRHTIQRFRNRIATRAFMYNPINYLTRKQRANYSDRERASFETQATERAMFELHGVLPQ